MDKVATILGRLAIGQRFWVEETKEEGQPTHEVRAFGPPEDTYASVWEFVAGEAWSTDLPLTTVVFVKSVHN